MHIDIEVAWVTLRLSTMQKVIHYHNFFKYITSFTYVFWDPTLNCTIQNAYQILKQATDTPGGSRRAWELSRVGMCVACLPPLPSPLFPFSWELVALGTSSIIWGEATVLTDARGEAICMQLYLLTTALRFEVVTAFLLDCFREKAVYWLRAKQSCPLGDQWGR